MVCLVSCQNYLLLSIDVSGRLRARTLWLACHICNSGRSDSSFKGISQFSWAGFFGWLWCIEAYYATYFLQTSALALTKLSILILLRRIFVIRAFRITVWILGGIIVAWWIAITIGNALICFPQGSPWKPNLKTAACADRRLMNEVAPIPWVLTDFAILLCPIPVLENLQVPRGKRIGLYAVFLMGGMWVFQGSWDDLDFSAHGVSRTCVVSVLRYRTLFNSLDDLTCRWTFRFHQCRSHYLMFWEQGT